MLDVSVVGGPSGLDVCVGRLFHQRVDFFAVDDMLCPLFRSFHVPEGIHSFRLLVNSMEDFQIQE